MVIELAASFCRLTFDPGRDMTNDHSRFGWRDQIEPFSHQVNIHTRDGDDL